jgi:hypothetical protein
LELVPNCDNENDNKQILLQRVAGETTTSSLTSTRPTTVAPAKSTPVVYVTPQHAKHIKAKLVERGWLDKGVRMVTVENVHGKVIAIPILQQYSSQHDGHDDWQEAILGKGYEENLPLSSSRFAALGKK